MLSSEFTDEYQDWLDGAPGQRRSVRFLDRTLGELEHAPVLSVQTTATLSEVIGRMNRELTTAALVLEGEKVVGIFTERDVLTRVIPRGLDVMRAQVSEVMTQEPHVLGELTLLSSALRVLALGSYHHLPVLDAQGRPKALVSLGTIVSYLVDAFPHQIMNAPPDHESFPPVKEGA